MKEAITDDIITILKERDFSKLKDYSLYAPCIGALIEALDKNISIKNICESLPHYSFYFTLNTLRSIFARVGYESTFTSLDADSITKYHLPCLCINDDGDPIVIESMSRGLFIYFNPKSGKQERSSLFGLKTIYSFRYKSPDQADQVECRWFTQVLISLKTLFKSLIPLSIILNVTVLCVPLFIMVIYDKVINSSVTEPLLYLAIGIGSVMVIDLIMRLARGHIMAILAGRMEFLLSTESLKKILCLPSAMTETASVSSQLSRLNLYDNIRDFFTGTGAFVIMDLPFVPLFIIIMGLLGGVVAIVPIVAIGLFFLVGLLFLPYLQKKIEFSSKAKNDHDQIVMETLSGLGEIKSMGLADDWLTKVDRVSNIMTNSSLDVLQIQSLLKNITYSISSFSAVAIVAIGGYQALHQMISTGELIAVMAIMWRTISPLQHVLLTYIQFTQIKQGIDGINDLMALKNERNISRSSMLTNKIKGDIKFERVSFRYSAYTDPVLIGASFHIRKNEVVAIVGNNGSGKSTIMKLLCGMYYPQAGNIYIGDSDIRQYNVGDLRHAIAYVPQHPRLFHGSISKNIKLKSILASDQDVKIAAKKAGILTAIQSLPEGFDTFIGDRSTDTLPASLQRGLCLARAFVSDAELILLDEPIVSHNKESSDRFIDQLKMLKHQATVIFTTHVPELIKIADKVIITEKGIIKKIQTSSDYLKAL